MVYATDLKHSIVGVRRHDLERYGPVHGVVAAQLASGARLRLEADYGIAATGVAGPADQGPRSVGEVFIAVASEVSVTSTRYEFDGSRHDIRIATVVAALSDLVDVLDSATTRSDEGNPPGRAEP